ncbi:hypothetical protein CI15_23200 [Paraburkholderia monticola]|uniref:Phasin domain-containing protein n=2 Tax=Paraburkholderia monticola TaxID=1399968 RepID=A0A149PH83_9BURK|nr:hypothetical protein CI15_23200 [Paraburkholderia monticola]
MPMTLSVPISVTQLPGQFVAGVCALTRLNADTCRSAFAGAAQQWENVLLAQTPEQFVRRQADVMSWLALQFAGYTRGWMDIVSETIGLGHAARDHDDGHEPEAGATPAGTSADATAVDAMTRGAVPEPEQAEGESAAGRHTDAWELTRAILSRAAKPDSDTAKRQNPPRTRRSSTR